VVLLPPPDPRSRTSTRGRLWEESRGAQLLARLTSRQPLKTTDSAGVTTESGLLKAQDGSCSPNGQEMTFSGPLEGHGLLRASQGPEAKTWSLGPLNMALEDRPPIPWQSEGPNQGAR
jgi:hypothetical protein